MSRSRILHDNLCPHVKRVLDRALKQDLPPLAGVAFVNSCDAMRRLMDAWGRVRPDDPRVWLDLPVRADETMTDFLAGELADFARTLSQWSGLEITSEGIRRSVDRYDRIAGLFGVLRERLRRGTMRGGSVRLQSLYNRAAAEEPGAVIGMLEEAAAEPEGAAERGVPIYLFGNVLPDPEVFRFLESCGARVVGEDLCTGSRQVPLMSLAQGGEPLAELARALLSRPACARTLDPSRPGRLAETLLGQARASGALGAICHTVKFCDPYLARLPHLRALFRSADLPLLLLEGDCTLRSLGQQRTRVQAFLEMLR